MNVQSTIQGIDADCMPWFVNVADNPDDEYLWVQYDHLTCYMIELAYKKYKAGDKTHR